MNNIAIVEKGTNRLIAYISDECIVDKKYELVDYGDNNPIFIKTEEEILIKPNSFELKW